MFDKPSIADGVAFALGVLAAIDFDDKPLLSTDKIDEIRPATDKIDEIRPDWLLTHEFESAERP